MLDRDALDIARGILNAPDFYADANRRIWEAAVELDDQSQPVDATTVAALLKTRGRLQQIGGVQYLAQITDATPAVAHIDAHAGIVRDKARQRRMVAVCQRYAGEGYGDVGAVDEWLQGAEAAVYEAAQRPEDSETEGDIAALIPPVLDGLKKRRADGGSIPGIDTGWLDLTRKLNGWVAGELYFVAGRPGMGKTALLLGAALNVARAGYGAIMVSAEMGREQLVQRAIASAAGVDVARFMCGRLRDEDWASACVAAEELRRLPVAITYQPGATVSAIRSAVRRQTRALQSRVGDDLPLGLVVVDYLQILDGQRAKNDSRETEVSTLSRRLKWLAGEFGVPVLAASQLNRAVELRQNKRPQLADLRESGAIEQDAYAILFMYRDEYYRPDTPDKGVLEVNIAKHRNGPAGVVEMQYQAESTRISCLAREHEPDDFGEGWDRV
jgi:replicative DNA helicase